MLVTNNIKTVVSWDRFISNVAVISINVGRFRERLFISGIEILIKETVSKHDFTSRSD